MSFARWGMGMAMAAFVGGAVLADDVTGMKSELADLKAKVAAMESTQMAPAAGGDCESLTSMKKKGAIKIGGNVEVAVMSISRDAQNVTASTGQDLGEDDNVNSTVFNTNDAMLDFKVSACKDAFLYMRLDLDDMWGRDNGNVAQDDLLDQVYFMWENVKCSNIDIWFGKKDIPFAMNKDPLLLAQITDTTDGTQSSFLGQRWEEAANNTATTNTHGVLGDYAHPGMQDNLFQAGMAWSMKDLLKIEVAAFQSRAYTNGVALSSGNGAATRGMFEDRSDDTGIQSFASRLTVTPLEGLTLMASLMTEHYETGGDAQTQAGAITNTTWSANRGAAPNQGSDATSDRQAASLAASWEAKCIPLELWAEYIVGWNWAWNSKYDTDSYTLGARYGITEAIDLFLIGDMLLINDCRTRYQQEENYYRLAVAGQYKFDNGIKLSLEYSHEMFRLDQSRQTGAPAGARAEGGEADVIIFGTMWNF